MFRAKVEVFRKFAKGRQFVAVVRTTVVPPLHLVRERWFLAYVFAVLLLAVPLAYFVVVASLPIKLLEKIGLQPFRFAVVAFLVVGKHYAFDAVVRQFHKRRSPLVRVATPVCAVVVLVAVVLERRVRFHFETRKSVVRARQKNVRVRTVRPTRVHPLLLHVVAVRRATVVRTRAPVRILHEP